MSVSVEMTICLKFSFKLHEDEKRNVSLSFLFHNEENVARRGRFTAPLKTKRPLKNSE